MRNRVQLPCFFLCLGVLVLLATPAQAQYGAQDAEWRYYGGDSGATKYAPLDQINKDNVGTLRIAWRRPAIDAQITEANPKLRFSNNFRSTPIMVDGVLYASNGIGLVEAFDPATGKTLWVQAPPVEGVDGLRGGASRGVAYWRDGSEERILAVSSEYLIALNPKTGEPYWDFGNNGIVDLKTGLGPLATTYRWTSAPLVIRNVVIVGSSMSDSPRVKEAARGDIRAFDVRTGELRWTFHVIPQVGEVGNESWEADSWEYTGHANVWSLMSADEELGYVYLPVTSPTSDMYGGHRLGDNLFGQSLLCLAAETGERVWHFQLVHHGLWDYDPPAAPVLADIMVDGRKIKVVIQVTKQAFAFVFERATGEPVWPIEERPVPQSDIPGERTSPTQPFPTKPPPFDRQGVSVDDLIDFTSALRAEAIEISKQYRLGPLFTPPSLKGDGPGDTKGTLQLPGSVGGADWNGAAFDPETGTLYVPSVTGAFAADLLEGNPDRTNLRYVRGTRVFVEGPQGLPLLKPPYGRITAIDLNRGEHAWMVPNGDGPRDHPALKHLNLPPLGQPGRASPLVTKTLLFVGEGDRIMIRTPPGGGGNKFRAYDKATGKVLWETALPAGTTGAPMTYMFDGKQYIVVAVGGREHAAEFVALSLP